jgi:arylsulfatase A-like enzyme
MAGAVSEGIIVYRILSFLAGFSLPVRVGAGLGVASLVIVLVANIPRVLDIGKRKEASHAKSGPNIKIINKQEITSKDKPNILLITPDTLRSDHLSCYGYKNIDTPAIDSIAADGVLFKNTVSASPWTLPSFASILTSLYPTVHKAESKIYDKKTGIGEEIITLTQILKEIGYHTRAHIQNLFFDKYFGFHRGFDYYRMFSHKIQEKIAKKKRAFLWINYLYKTSLKENSSVNNVVKSTEEVLRWLEQNDRERNPFFLWLHYFDPHLPYERYKSYGLDRDYEGPLADDRFVRKLDMPELRIGSLKLDQAAKKHFISLYDEEVLFVDENIDKILKKLRKLNLIENTIIIFTSDHGEEFWEHGAFEHGHTLYRELLQVPLLIRFPQSLPSGKTIDAQVRTIDIMPTVLEMLGVKHDIPLTGKSLLPLVRGEEKGGRTAFSESLAYYEERKSIKKGKYKLIYFPDSKISELYYLETDPQEKNNVFSQRKKEALSLKEELITWMKDSEKLAQKLSKGEKSKPVKLDKKTKKELKSLGYIN